MIPNRMTLATHTPLHEAIAQLLFYSSMASLPASAVLFGRGFRSAPQWRSVLLLATAGCLLTQFLWYFVYLGNGLANSKDPAPAWWHFAPIGFGIALLVLALRICYRKI